MCNLRTVAGLDAFTSKCLNAAPLNRAELRSSPSQSQSETLGGCWTPRLRATPSSIRAETLTTIEHHCLHRAFAEPFFSQTCFVPDSSYLALRRRKKPRSIDRLSACFHSICTRNYHVPLLQRLVYSTTARVSPPLGAADMDPRWAPYNSSADRQSRTNMAAHASPRQQQQDSNGAAMWNYDSYQEPQAISYDNSAIPSASDKPQTLSATYTTDEDLPMEDADPFNNQKYHARSQPHRSRPSSQYLPAEDSFAARRYSPMHQSPSTSYPGSPPGPSQNQYAPFTPLASSSRQSPTRPSMYASHPQSYHTTPCKSSRELIWECKLTHYEATRPQPSQLPPLQPALSPDSSYYPPGSATQQLNAVFGRDPVSPSAAQAHRSPLPRGQVPRFVRCRDVAELKPRINHQPLYRRANPEGGFISVCGLYSSIAVVVGLTLPNTASPSSNDSSPFYLPHMQSKLQIRIITEP